MRKEEIKENVKVKTSEGRVGNIYAVKQIDIDNGIVNVFFEGSGSVMSGDNYAPPSGRFNIDKLETI